MADGFAVVALENLLVELDGNFGGGGLCAEIADGLAMINVLTMPVSVDAKAQRRVECGEIVKRCDAREVGPFGRDECGIVD